MLSTVKEHSTGGWTVRKDHVEVVHKVSRLSLMPLGYVKCPYEWSYLPRSHPSILILGYKVHFCQCEKSMWQAQPNILVTSSRIWWQEIPALTTCPWDLLIWMALIFQDINILLLQCVHQIFRVFTRLTSGIAIMHLFQTGRLHLANLINSTLPNLWASLSQLVEYIFKARCLSAAIEKRHSLLLKPRMRVFMFHWVPKMKALIHL